MPSWRGRRRSNTHQIKLYNDNGRLKEAIYKKIRKE